jgi:hypothetical protein
MELHRTSTRWSTTTRLARASTTTGICAAAATPAARSTTPPGTPSSTAPAPGSTACRSGARSSSSPRAPAGGRHSSPRRASSRSTTPASAPLDRARDRLLAHGLRAHIHVRDAWAEPDRQVDALFCGFWLSHVERDRTGDFLALARRWLKPGGIFAFIDSLPDPQSGAADHPAPSADTSVRRLDDGRSSRSSRSTASPAELESALRDAGFATAAVATTGRFFVLGSATA